MLRRIFDTEHHLKRLQAGFFEPPSWLEKCVPRYSIRKLVMVSIYTILGFFFLIMLISSAENRLLSRHQKTISDKVFPLLMASRALQDNLTDLASFKYVLQKAQSRDELEASGPISALMVAIESHSTQLKKLTGKDLHLRELHLSLDNNFMAVKKSLYALYALKSKQVEASSLSTGFQKEARQQFKQMALLEEAMSGKVSLMSVRLLRLLKRQKIDDPSTIERQRKVDTTMVQVGLALSRLGKLLIEFNGMKSHEELLNFRDNELKQNLVLLDRQARIFAALSKPLRQGAVLHKMSVDLTSQIDGFQRLLLGADKSLYAFAERKIALSSNIKVLSGEIDDSFSEMEGALKRVSLYSEKVAKESIDKLQTTVAIAGWVTVLSGSGLALLLILFLATVMRRINEPIDRLNSAMHKLSAGDMSVRLSDEIAVSDEFSRLWLDFNRFAERTERLVNEQNMIFDNAEIGIAWMRDRQYLRVNPKLLEIFRADEEYLLGKNSAKNCFSEEIYEEIGKGYSILEKGGTFTGEFLMKRADGTLFWCKLAGKSTGLGKSTDSVWLHEDITERKLAEKKLYELANYDGLTGLPNRSFFTLMLEQAIQRAKRNKTEFAVLFIDLDRFKHINDSLGHDVGDQVLCEISKRIQNVIRVSDVAARLGGDEFTVVVDTFGTTSDLLNVAEKINLELSRGIMLERRELFVGASIGISLYPQDGLTPAELLSHADVAMYAAKEKGRNNAQFYNRQIGLNSDRFMELSNSLRLALENNEFELYFQPKIELKTRSIIGMEALIRWNRPEIGLVSPFEFIPVLEESGLMSEVGSWVIQEAGRIYQKWVEQGLDPGHIAVNLSERQFNNDQLLDSLSAVLTDNGIPASALELEITESLMMGDAHNATKVLKEIKERGFDIAMDDFGTGYSSLAYLKRFPIDTIKIDRTFVRDIAVDEDDEAIVDAILAIAKQLKLKTVAEGIETEEQLALLLGKECEIGQGYLFSKPVPAAEMAELLGKGVL